TGAASGVATKYLARRNSSRVGLLGSGIQAQTQLQAMCAVRPIKLAKVFSPTSDHRASFAKRMAAKLGIEVIPVTKPEEAVRESDIVIAASAAKTPIMSGNWLMPGTHVNGIGSHTPDARELDENTIKRSKIVVDSMEAALREAGDLLIPIANGIVNQEHIFGELGELVLGKKAGRINEDEITLFKSQGLAIEDISTAKLVYQKAKAAGKGMELHI
ncbi:MAG: ornithine cyclodeaminase family protein, partial [Candidatus Binatia bacterium]